MTKQIILLFLVFLMLSCDSNNHIRTYHLPKIHHTNNETFQTKSQKPQLSGFTWEKPDSWIPSQGSSMRIASFDVPFSTGMGDLSVMELGGDGGGLVANVNRWRGQIGLEPLEESEIRAQAQPGESKIGPYEIFQLINDSNSNTAMLTAILPMNNSTLYIKLTASKDGIIDLEKDFKTFCSSIKHDTNI
ncbi:MAG: hypothetical protein QF835_02250 [Candidatus Marinimicrobia bacterium]|jgi:hypothetical protein|nr:hypothetical protein [Candidatus Neomarinimicrobiota bacterium]